MIEPLSVCGGSGQRHEYHHQLSESSDHGPLVATYARHPKECHDPGTVGRGDVIRSCKFSRPGHSLVTKRVSAPSISGDSVSSFDKGVGNFTVDRKSSCRERV